MDPIEPSNSSLHGWSLAQTRRFIFGSVFVLGTALTIYLLTLGVSKPRPAAAASAQIACFSPAADAYVNSAAADTNFGSNANLMLQAGPNGTSLIYALFDLSELPADSTVITATLQLYMDRADVAEIPSTLRSADGTWDELKITYNNQPGSSGTYDTQIHNNTVGIKEWDATKLVMEWHSGNLANNGLVIEPGAGGPFIASYASREHLQEPIPQLCINWLAPTPTRTPLPTWTPVPTNTPTPGPTPTPTLPVFSAPYYAVVNAPIFVPLNSDLSIFGIEITQGIQCFDTSKGLSTCPNNTLPVVNKKDSTARIYLKYSGSFSSMSNVPVRLHIFANGVEYIANATGKATKVLDQSTNNDARVYFNVNFTNDIQVSFYAEVDPDHTILETNESNNRYPASGTFALNFRRRDTLRIVGDRLRYHPSGYSGTQYAGGWAVNGGAADWYEQVLPIRNNGINYSVKSGYQNWTSTLSTGNGQHSLIQYLNSQWILENAFSWLFGSGAFTGADHVYGWAPNDGYTGGHADMPVYPHAGGLGVVAIGTDRAGTSTDNPGGGALIFGHEITHDYNVFHTNTGLDDCGSDDSNSDFPYGTSSIQEFGFNPVTGKIYDPANTHDLMSYCPANGSKLGWISPFTWNKMFNNLSPTLTTAADTMGTAGALQTTASEQSLVVHATIYNPDFSPTVPGELGDLYRLSTNLAYPLPAGDYAIQLRSNSTILYTQTFTVSFEGEYDPYSGIFADVPADEPPFPPGPSDRADLSFIMPWAVGTTQIQLMHGNEILDQRSVSANPPQVSITDPVGSVEWPAGTTQTLSWSGSDPDGDSLSYSVLYSSDGGVGWQLLIAGLTETSLDLQVDALAGTNDARFRVVATDGVNTAFDETPNPISVPNKPPWVVITEPEDQAVFAPGSLVLLKGSATDLEDGNLPDEALHWSSDRQGSLGIGPSLPMTSLEPGWHLITLSVVDSYGIPGSETRKIFIGHVNYLPVITR